MAIEQQSSSSVSPMLYFPKKLSFIFRHRFRNRAAYAVSDISSACRPTSLYEWFITSVQHIGGMDQYVAPKLEEGVKEGGMEVGRA